MDSKTLAQRKSVFWRIHLWAAFIATPFALVGALTGMLYIFTPQIEAAWHGHLDRVVPQNQALALDALVALAQQAAPKGAALRYVVTPETADQSVRVYFAPAGGRKAAMNADDEHAEHQAASPPAEGQAGAGRPQVGAGKPDANNPGTHLGTNAGANPGTNQGKNAGMNPDGKAGKKGGMDHGLPQGSIVYINPYSGDVLGVQAEMDRFSTWSKRLHSSLLQGNGWRWLLELSTSWMFVMLLTGLYLWWPRDGAAVRPDAGLQTRAGWKQWHAFTGMVLAAMSLVILVTGLTWSRQAGQQIKAAADWVGQGSPEAPKHLRTSAQPGQHLLGWQGVWDAARTQAPSIAYQLNPPKQADEPWRISNFDRSQPTKRFNLLLDGHSGQTLYYHGWESFTLFSKATAVGIPFHRGEFGWWNQSLLLAFGLGVLWWLVSGWVMFAKRKRQGWLGLPRVLPGAWGSLPVTVWVSVLVLLAGMPVWAWSVAAVALIEVWWAWRPVRPPVAA